MKHLTYKKYILHCRCGETFRTYAQEARHRHNFPSLCRKGDDPNAATSAGDKTNIGNFLCSQIVHDRKDGGESDK